MDAKYAGFTRLIEQVGLGIDAFGVFIILIGALGSVSFFIFTGRSTSFRKKYGQLRENLGRTILLGLEFLVAGDIIRTVAVSPTYRSVGLLGIIIVIRFVISMQLELEVNGCLPWKRKISQQSEIQS